MKNKLPTIVFVCFVALYVPLAAFFIYGDRAPFGFFAEDSFYYFTVAKNSSLLFTTFDMAQPTNGFHPLWQYLLILIFRVLGPDQNLQILTVYFASCVLVAAGLCFAALALLRVTRSFHAVMWLVPGPFFALFNFPRNVKGITYNYSCWSFMNGMESVLSVFWGGILLYFLSGLLSAGERGDEEDGSHEQPMEITAIKGLAMGLVLAMCVLSRLDDVFLVAGFGFLCLFIGRRFSGKIRAGLILLGPPVLLVSLYMIYNKIQYGTPLPTSGQIKGGITIPKLMENINGFAANLFPQVSIDPQFRTWSWWTISANRNAGTLVPAIVSLVLLLKLMLDLRRGKREFSGLLGLAPLMIYMVMKGSYNFLCVRWFDQAYWYYALFVLFFNFIVLTFLFRPLRLLPKQSQANFKLLSVVIWVLYFGLISGQTLSMLGGPEHFSYRFWKNRKTIEAELKRIDPKMKLLDDHDGIVGYALNIPTMSITGLVSDLEGLKRKKNNSYLGYALLERGHNVLAGLRQQGYFPLSYFQSCGWKSQELYHDQQSDVTFNRLTLPSASSKSSKAK